MPPRECNPDYCSPLTSVRRRRRRRRQQQHRHHPDPTSQPSSSCLSPSSQDQTRRRRRRRRKVSSEYSVRFATGSDLVKVHPYLREPHNTTAAIRNAIWYNHDDFQTFKDECRQDAAVVVVDDDAIVNRDGNDVTSLVVCTRGIERMTKEACQKYQDHRTVLIGEIALYQHRFKGKNKRSSSIVEKEEEDLAKILSERTSHDVKEAQVRAEQDQEFSLQYLKEDEEEESSSSLDDGTTTRKRIFTIGGTIRDEIENTIIHHDRSSSAYYSYHCRLPPLTPSNYYNSSSSSTSSRRRRGGRNSHSSPTNGGNIIIQNRRKLRARTSKLFREEHLHRLFMEEL